MDYWVLNKEIILILILYLSDVALNDHILQNPLFQYSSTPTTQSISLQERLISELARTTRFPKLSK